MAVELKANLDLADGSKIILESDKGGFAKLSLQIGAADPVGVKLSQVEAIKAVSNLIALNNALKLNV